MRVSELISDLQRVLENDGDIKIAVEADDWLFYDVGVQILLDNGKPVAVIN